jgi:uncharacterized protein YjiS (DUF1127 family)
MTIMTQTAIYGSSSLDSTSGLVARIRKSWADHRLYLGTVRELEQLSDRELADLGIHRASIPGIARASVYPA